MEEQASILDDIKADEVEVPYLKRLLTSLFDWIIELVLIIVLYFLLPKELMYSVRYTNRFTWYIFIFIVLFSYRFVCLFVFGKTVGMLICKSKYLNGALQPLSPKEKLIAVFAPKTSNNKYYKD